MMKNPTANVDDMPIDELTEMTRKYLDEEFMLGFIEEGAKAMVYSHNQSIQAKKALLAKTESLLDFFRNQDIDKKQAQALVEETIKLVNDAIDHLQVAKNSVEYTFASSIKDAVKKYFAGVAKNPKEQDGRLEGCSCCTC